MEKGASQTENFGPARTERGLKCIFYLSPHKKVKNEMHSLPDPPPPSTVCISVPFFFISLTLEEGREEKLALNNNFFN